MLASSPLLAKFSMLYVEREHRPLHHSNLSMVSGYSLGAEPASAEGYMDMDERFIGKLQYSNRTIYADALSSEQIMRIFKNFSDDDCLRPPDQPEAGSSRHTRDVFEQYENETLGAGDSRRRKVSARSADVHVMKEADPAAVVDGRDAPSEDEGMSLPVYVFKQKPKPEKKLLPMPEFVTKPELPQRNKAKARMCELLILADHLFFKLDANSSWELAAKLMFNAVSLADDVFRNADFDEDGVPDNIGFSVKYAMVLTSASTHRRIFGSATGGGQRDGREYLMSFAAVKKLSDVCLGIAFTGHSFKNDTIGLSFTSLSGDKGVFAGGICDRNAAGLSYNILAVAHGGRQARVPPRLAGLALAHELGHSFGAQHDELFPHRGCHHYVMGRSSLSGERPTHFQFSECSRRVMREVIDRAGSCLVHDDRPFCGNGIVEGDEACDCGLPATCAASDPCCTPKTGSSAGFANDKSITVSGCMVSPAAQCHPSQGGCCHRNCTFADHSDNGIDCTRIHERCPCATDAPRCACGLGGECLRSGECVAAECARLGLRECTCPTHGPGGVVGQSKRCGVCCILSDMGEETCASAETAARRQLTANRVTLAHLRDDEFSGPSVFFKLCLARRSGHGGPADDGCAYVSLRAWHKREACAAMGELGRCSPSGVCVPPQKPAPNIYPVINEDNSKPIDLSPAASYQIVRSCAIPSQKHYHLLLYLYCIPLRLF